MKSIELLEAEKILGRFVPAVKETSGKGLTLERMEPLLSALGNPEKKLKIIHVAGTSGKTSTCYFLAEILHKTGQKVGLTVSPHIDSVTERLQINLKPINDTVFLYKLKELVEIVDKHKLSPTYFELLTAMSFWYFERQKVDYAVIETGLGGLLDASNVAQEANKVCVITDIGFDHMNILGSTISDISAQKAGIIHEQNQVFMYEQLSEVMSQINLRIKQKNARLKAVEPKVNLSKNLADFQARNLNLALAAAVYVAERDGFELDWTTSANNIHIQVPARMEVKQIKGKTLIMDGAHNGQKMKAFVDSFQRIYSGKKATVLLSLKQDKEYHDVFGEIKKICNELIITSFAGWQDTPTNSIEADYLAEAAKKSGFINIRIEKNSQKAYQELLKVKNDTLVITGSFYLIAELRQHNPELT